MEVYVALQYSFIRPTKITFFSGDFNQAEVDKFDEESLKMSRFRHAHVMGLIGVCLDAGPAPYIVMPYMANGSLLHYLKKERQSLVFSLNTEEDEVNTLLFYCSPNNCFQALLPSAD